MVVGVRVSSREFVTGMSPRGERRETDPNRERCRGGYGELLGTDAFRPLAGEPIWEFIERGGSYGAPLALAWVQGWRQTIAAGAHRAMSPRSS
jgi:hypothetical protein